MIKDDKSDIEPLKVDIHSHLLPGIDDGSESLEESIEMLKVFSDMGYEKVITTPHIMVDFYKNTPEIIREKLYILRKEIAFQNINIEIKAAAEYYLDEGMMDKLKKEESLLTFGNRYLLFETSFISPSVYINEAIFAMKMQGYQPVLAHPERYIYLHNNFDEIIRIRELDVDLQMNVNSLCQYYSKAVKNFAQKLINKKLISFIGSDCHRLQHLEMMKEATQQSYYKKALRLNILNNIL